MAAHQTLNRGLGSNPGIPALYEAENLINRQPASVSAGDLLFLLI